MKPSQDAPSPDMESPKPPRRFLRWLIGAGAVAALLAVLAIDTAPDHPPAPAPSATQAQKAKMLFDRVQKASKRGGPQPISANWSEIHSVALLAGRLSGISNFSLAPAHNESGRTVVARGSYPLPLGLWANGQVQVATDQSGRPTFSGQIGSLPVPEPLMHIAIASARFALKLRGITIPAPQNAIQNLSITQAGVSARMDVRTHIRSLGRLADLRPAAKTDSAAVAKVYCGLAKAVGQRDSVSLPVLIRHGFVAGSGAKPDAVLFAVAMYSVSPAVGNMAGVSNAAIKPCLARRASVTLRGRADLAKHWALSAALTATLGEQASDSLGVWKEVADSGTRGSGFSYVDIAADRSGTMIGTLAGDPANHLRLATWLAKADDEALLPISKLALEEGLPEAEFIRKYAGIDSANHDKMVAQIDSALARQLPM